MDYELVAMEFKPESLQSPAYLAKNPGGRIPTLEDGDTVIFESGAILQYLLEKYGKGRLEPKIGSPERPAYLQWFHWAEGTALPPISDFVQHAMMRPEDKRIAAVVPDAAERIQQNMAVLDGALKGKQYITGNELTAADVMLGYAVHLVSLTGQLGAAYPIVKAYFERVSARPAFQKAFA
jgi:glutathione S-transferase